MEFWPPHAAIRYLPPFLGPIYYMSQQGPYQIRSPAGEIHHVAFEVWLLDQFWNTPTLVDHTYSDFRAMLMKQGLTIPPNFEDLIQLKIIALKPGTGVTVVTPITM